MTFYEKEAAEELKRKIFFEQGGVCPVCNWSFENPSQAQAAHRIVKSKVNLRKYGKKIIHHRLNLVCTHDVCNSCVIVNPDKQEGKDLIEEIKEAIANGST